MSAAAALDGQRRLAHRRTSQAASPLWPSRLGRLWTAIQTSSRRDHSLTAYPCRRPDGTVGQVAVIEVDGEWVMVCRAGPARSS